MQPPPNRARWQVLENRRLFLELRSFKLLCYVPCLLLVCVAGAILGQAVVAARSCGAAPPEGSEEGGLDAEDSAGAGATAGASAESGTTPQDDCYVDALTGAAVSPATAIAAGVAVLVYVVVLISAKMQQTKLQQRERVALGAAWEVGTFREGSS